MAENILEVKHLKKYFSTPRGQLHAVDDVNFTIEHGKTLGVVGESGCGKSTLGNVIIGLHTATSGQILFKGENITDYNAKKRKHLLTEMQMIFQDPFSSLNPRMCVSQLIAEPLRNFKICKSKEELEKKVAELMDLSGLAKRLRFSYPHELDGGRRQRIGIARALALDPDFVICDEPVSALDVSIQAQILNLMMDIQEAKGITYMFITHDLSVVKHISSDIMVMYLGCVVEKAKPDELFQKQLHPYTKGLLTAIPVPSLERVEKNILMGEITSPIEPPKRCRFYNRCVYAKDRCAAEEPTLEEVLPGHFVACHYVREINQLSAAETNLPPSAPATLQGS